MAWGLGHPGAALGGLPLVGVALTGHPRTRPYGLGVLVAYGVTALVALTICGFTLTHMKM